MSLIDAYGGPASFIIARISTKSRLIIPDVVFYVTYLKIGNTGCILISGIGDEVC